MVTDDTQNAGGVMALRRLKSTEPPLYLSASSELSEAARLASKYLYSSLKPYTPKSPFSQLLTDGFDAEQIWQQIDLQSEPLLASLGRQIRQFEKKPEEIEKVFGLVSGGIEKKSDLESEKGESEEFKDVDMDDDDDDEDSEEDEEEEEEEEGDEDEKREEVEEEKGGAGGVEDRFFKIDELEEYMEDDEAREYGLKKKTKKIRSNKKEDEDEEEDDEEGDDEDEEDDDELGFMGLGDDEDGEGTEIARYEDFFGSKKGTGQKKNAKSSDLSDGLGTDDDMIDDSDDNQKKRTLSTHEKEVAKLRSTIEDMEKANLEEKAWTMQGEVTATRRPKNSALEVDLDFEHNVRPAPVITEEVTATLEELIQNRIIESRFDDVQKPASLPSSAPREKKELDDNKSKKGLAEIYEDEYQKTGLVSTALSFSEEQKKEATMLFKKLCLKLDALSHFHFTPKPVIEDMSVQANVPALAMEEIAPVAVSDAAMLAPEEIFSGKGDVKEETELTQAERKRRRANKKRKFKAESAKRMVKPAPENASSNGGVGNDKS